MFQAQAARSTQHLACKDPRHLGLSQIGKRLADSVRLPIHLFSLLHVTPTSSHRVPRGVTKKPQTYGLGAHGLPHADQRLLTPGAHGLSSGSRLLVSRAPRAPGGFLEPRDRKAPIASATRRASDDPRRPRPGPRDPRPDTSPARAVAHPGQTNIDPTAVRRVLKPG